MRVIRARNVQQALPLALDALRAEGIRRDSRNGPVIQFREPVTTVYLKPAERVIFWPQRDANPFFHLIESLWMLAGRNDVEFVAKYVARMRSFSDDGVTFHGAYGYRWRNWFDFDQLPKIIDALRANPEDRRQVLSMWDANADLGRQGKDLPCNLQAIFQIAPDGRLDMMVTNRSNDIIWGAYGANAVHFSYLHEFVARSVGVPQGIYRQVSANFHAYVDVLETVEELADEAPGVGYQHHWSTRDPYTAEVVQPFPLMSSAPEDWYQDLQMLMTDPFALGIQDPFFRRVAIPMLRAHDAYRTKSAGRYDAARHMLERCEATDWKRAGLEWITRREEAARAKAHDDGSGKAEARLAD
jgi:hypothetical protein